MLDYVVSLARQNTDAIGFLPRPRLEQYADAGQILIAHENGDPCGFLVYGNGWPELRIYQACIQYDARRRENGLRLVSQLEDIAIQRGASSMSLWCGSDLDANDFWRLAGFSHAATREGGVRRGRALLGWRKMLDMPAQLDLGVDG